MQLVTRPADDHARRRVDRDLVAAGDRLELARRLGDHGREVELAVRRLAAGVRAREEQQVADQPAHAPRRAQGRGRGLLLLALERLVEQLEVGQHRRQRRAQLVRGVGDELALALERGLGVVARLAERGEHRRQRARQLGDLVLGLRARQLRRRVARLRDVARRRGQLGDRRHRAARRGQAGQQRERGAAEHAEREEELDQVGRRAHVRQAPRVLDVDGVRQRDRDRPRLHPPAVLLDRLRLRGPEVRRVRARLDRVAVEVDDADRGVLRSGVGVQVRVRALPLGAQAAEVGLIRLELDRPRQVVGPAGHLAVEVRLDPLRRQDADDRREPAQDHERQRGRAAGEAPADRDAPIRGGRSPRRGPCVGAEARHRLRASSSGWTRTPRSCS